MIKFSSLFSGSSGNCSYVYHNGHAILIDAGVSCQKIMMGLQEHQLTLQEIEGILLTHEHSDHIQGLKLLVDKHEIPLYCKRLTYEALHERYKPQNLANIYFIDDYQIPFQFPKTGFHVESYPISHDVQDGCFYIFQFADVKIVHITDTGYVAEHLESVLENADVYFIESNHEPALVLQSKYPWHIQQRILSDYGHLSNKDCALLLRKIIGEKTKHIILGHLSEENNRPDIALANIQEMLKKMERTDITLDCAEKNNVLKKPIKI